MFLKFRKNKNQSTNQFSNSNQKVKGGINVNVETSNAIETIMAHMDRVNKEMFDKLEVYNVKLTNLSTAFGVYVENNGVKPEVKKIVKEILKP